MKLPLVLLGFLAASSASAYSVEGGDVIARVVGGAGINTTRLESATRETPSAGLLLGGELELAFDLGFAFAGGVHFTLAPNFVDTRATAGLKYRLVALEAPLHATFTAQLTTAMGVPLSKGEAHWNLGFRGAMGLEYFVARNLSVFVETGFEPSALLFPQGQFESTVELLAGVGWTF